MNMKQIVSDFNTGKMQILTDENDTFNFGCKQCGECCLNNGEIMVTPWDVIRISEALQKPAIDVLSNTLKIHIGENTHIPVATLRSAPVPGTTVSACPYLAMDGSNIVCSIQKSKPFNCAIYPLGKMTQIDKTTGVKSIKYFVQPITCKADQSNTITLKDWLAMYDVDKASEASAAFTQFIEDTGKIINLELLDDQTDLGASYNIKQKIYNVMLVSLYGSYEPHGTTDEIKELNKIFETTIKILNKSVELEPGLKSF